jgi:hypothetical protein
MLALALVAALTGAGEFRLPANITVAASLLPIVEDALRASATLRDLCDQIGRIRRVRVRIDLDAPEFPAVGALTRAHTTIRRYQAGLIAADVHLWSSREAAELIAHELEHVREFAEGIDYRSQAARDPHGVWMTAPNTFETARALRAGRAVVNELAARDRLVAASGQRR